MKNPIVIENMNLEEVKTALQWAKEEGWNPGISDAECFYRADRDGFFAAKLNGEMIGSGSGVIYNEDFAFLGLYIVKKQYRGKKYGLQLTEKVEAYVGNRNTGLDGVLENVDKYASRGMRLAHKNIRFEGITKKIPQKDSSIIPATSVSFNQLVEYDSRHFPVPRAKFLECWINLPNGISRCYLQNNVIKGLGVIRPCYTGFKIGPLFADNKAIAEKLLFELINHVPSGEKFFLDVPEPNKDALELVKKLKMFPVFEVARMYSRVNPNLPLSHIFGITTFELG